MKVRKKPGELEAFQFLPNDDVTTREYPSWLMEGIKAGTIEATSTRADEPILIIHDPAQGDMIVRDTDWVMYGIEGNLYPTTDSIFQKTYEEIT